MADDNSSLNSGNGETATLSQFQELGVSLRLAKKAGRKLLYGLLHMSCRAVVEVPRSETIG